MKKLISTIIVISLFVSVGKAEVSLILNTDQIRIGDKIIY